MNTNWTIFQDLDGCLADFDKGVKQVTGKAPDQQPVKDMWRALAKHGDFYYSLDFMPDAKQLWSYVAPHNPIILSGLPLGNWAAGQKKRWVGEKLGWHIPTVLGMARDKPQDAMKYLGVSDLDGCILIDDRKKAQGPWEAAGGTFILHTSAKNTINQLKALDI
ncbi:MAG: hypothetical protein HC836_35620 [Richelia sp. RM2_1_2]|nr:hypothetical protein [Richelia sp. RM2_1_2]